MAMVYDDHNPPHFHAEYGEHEVLVRISTLAILSGSLPARALGLVTEWASLHLHAARPQGSRRSPGRARAGRWSDRPAGSFRTCSHTSPAGSGGSVLGTSERRGQPRGRRGRCGAPASRLSANGRPPRRPPGRGAEADGHNFGHNRPLRT